MLNKKIVAVLVSMSLIFSLAASGFAMKTTKSSVSQVTIDFWHTFSDTESKILTEKIIPDFEAKNPDIKVNAVKMPYDGLKQQVIQAVAGEAVPDVMRMDIIWVPEFAKLGALQAVDTLTGFNTLKADAFATPLSTCYYNGHYYGLPQDTNTKVAIYNNTILKKAGITQIPKTFDELIAAAVKAQKVGSLGIGVAGTGTWGMAPYFLSLGGKYTDDKHTKATGYLNGPSSISALAKLVSYYDRKLIGPCIIGGQPSTWDGMKADKYLMIDDGPWFFSILGKDIEKTTTVSVFPGSLGKGTSIVGGEDLVTFKGAKHPKEAWRFMQYMLSSYPQVTLGKYAGLIPTTKTASKSKDVLVDPTTQYYLQQLDTTWARTPHPNYGKIEAIVDLAFEKVFRHKTTPVNALNDAAAKVDKLLKDN
jgi:multiple sugar transport system substrate-binding protein